MKRILIPLNSKTMHGTFCREDRPVAWADSGDIIECSSLDGDWHWGKPPAPQSSAGSFFAGRTADDWGHALIGPIAVSGAEPGMTLAVHILENRPANWGWSRVGGNSSPHTRALRLDPENEFFLNWDLDLNRMTGTSHLGHTVPLAPFLGVIGLAPDAEGRLSTHPPRNVGGNLDCRDLIPGSTLYLPIECRNALLYLGDGHAAQGQGELGGTAIECPMERILIQVEVLAGLHLEMPRAQTPGGWITFGFNEDLTRASYQALEEMARLIMELYHVSQREALALTSLAVDQHVTQIVNGVRGVHAFLPNGAIHISKPDR